MSLINVTGTFETCPDVRSSVAIRGIPDMARTARFVEIGHERELDDAFLSLTRIRPNAILVVADPFLASQQTRIAEFLVQAKIPSIYTYREQVTAGGLVSYATNYHELFRRAAFMADKIHKGSKPGDLPVEQPTKFELVINLKTAKAIGLVVPPALLSRADEVIE